MISIYNLDDASESQPISSFAKGEHLIGRNTLNCKDARVSRNHAVITINDDNTASLKSTHANPIFYKPNGGNSIQLIKKESSSVLLKDGDQFGLLPDDYWFKIRLENDDLSSNRSLKRIHRDDTDGNDLAKKSKITDGEDNIDSDESFDFADLMEDPNNLNETNKNDNTSQSADNLDITINQSHNNSNIASHPENTEENTPENIPETVDEPSTSNNNSTTKATNVNSEDQIGVATTSLNQATHSDDTKNDDIGVPRTSKRVRCWYGETCYRRNPNHKKDFSHPCDSDYEESDQSIVAPCPFGDSCYRTNLNHRKQYKHSKPPAPKPQPPANPVNDSNSDEDVAAGDNNAGRMKRKAANKKKNYSDSPEDDYDFDDSFINDGSSDDYEASDDDGDSSDSDWRVSQAEPEESEETRRLIREARKFTKKKK
ncbi:unnamed protein product [Phyllotreta striolata]|uniref:Aprataxin and PNK-like factor n=1 Tax=Phyllotreta striolata TaxID=444603 RepID=A0A9N9TIR6_PHYSR|nr:unnamed protein product [Phyllotreta striolata]